MTTPEWDLAPYGSEYYSTNLYTLGVVGEIAGINSNSWIAKFYIPTPGLGSLTCQSFSTKELAKEWVEKEYQLHILKNL